MRRRHLTVKTGGTRAVVPVFRVHTLIIGSGAAGLNAAVQLHRRGVTDLCLVTEGLQMGTSINTGSDKQTYYKLGLYGTEPDAPRVLAESFFAGGSMHGDLALVEASLSARAFLSLANLGVPFPQDRYGQYVGYKTDHDPRQRATSIGPYTSREMCRVLIAEVKKCRIPVHEDQVVVSLLTAGRGDNRRVAGALALDAKARLLAYEAENVVLAAGGPGGLYKTSVYPPVHTGAIGLGLAAGARAQSLPESQYGLASIQFRWNVSGTYMQVVPRFISTAADGKSDEREFMAEYFDTPGQMNSMVFLKGYQWPFDARKTIGGSSLVDILVYIETVVRGRRVYLDFRRNPTGFDFATLRDEARDYLTRSKALHDTPIARLLHMNPAAVELYKAHDMDITREPLEVAVCAQHNNGGLAGNLWWESLNLKHLFPVGEINGSHGVYRPGGSALNSGQVAGFRASDYIAARYRGWTLDAKSFRAAAQEALADVAGWLDRAAAAKRTWKEERAEFQARMSAAGAHIRAAARLATAVDEAWAQVRRLEREGTRSESARDRIESLRNRQLCLAHAVYLEAIRFAIGSGVGSRGSAIVVDPNGQPVHPRLSADWRILPEDPAFRERVLETEVRADRTVISRWVPRRPLPACDAWFETAWAAYRNGEIYG